MAKQAAVDLQGDGHMVVVEGTWYRWKDGNRTFHRHNDATRYVDDVTKAEYRARPRQLAHKASTIEARAEFQSERVRKGNVENARAEIKLAQKGDVPKLQALKADEDLANNEPVLQAIRARLAELTGK